MRSVGGGERVEVDVADAARGIGGSLGSCLLAIECGLPVIVLDT